MLLVVDFVEGCIGSVGVFVGVNGRVIDGGEVFERVFMLKFFLLIWDIVLLVLGFVMCVGFLSLREEVLVVVEVFVLLLVCC